MSFYADTSFLFSYYASDANSSRTDVVRCLGFQVQANAAQIDAIDGVVSR